MGRRKVTTTIGSRSMMEQVFGEMAAACNDVDRLTAEMDAEIMAVRRRFEAEMKLAVDSRDVLSADLESWAKLNKGEFGGRRSIELLHGELGFRKTPPACKQVTGVKVAGSIDKIKQLGIKRFLRVKETLDKDRILEEHATKKITDAELLDLGLKVTQTEKFFVEVKTEEPPEAV